MSELVVSEGDRIVFQPTFGQRIVTLEGEPTMAASGAATIAQRRIAVAGDQKGRWPAIYTLFGYTEGRGFVEIIQLASDQTAPCTAAGAPVIRVGQTFFARFTPTVPALLVELPNTPDTLTPSMGQGYFIAQQNSVTASR